MAFTEKVDLFTMIREAGSGGDIMTIKEFHEDCASGCLMDYDGFGHAINADGYKDPAYFVVPSKREMIPASVTHIEWFNK